MGSSYSRQQKYREREISLNKQRIYIMSHEGVPASVSTINTSDNNIKTDEMFDKSQDDLCKVKLYQFSLTSEEPCRFLCECTFTSGSTVQMCKQKLLPGLRQSLDPQLTTDRFWLRSKMGLKPGTIFLESDVFGKNIILMEDREFFLELWTGPAKRKDSVLNLMLLVRRWRPSLLQLEPIQEALAVQVGDVEALKKQISNLSEIQHEDIQLVMLKDVASSLDGQGAAALQQLGWAGDLHNLSDWDDGDLILYRDKTEHLPSRIDKHADELLLKEMRYTMQIFLPENTQNEQRVHECTVNFRLLEGGHLQMQLGRLMHSCLLSEGTTVGQVKEQLLPSLRVQGFPHLIGDSFCLCKKNGEILVDYEVFGRSVCLWNDRDFYIEIVSDPSKLKRSVLQVRLHLGSVQPADRVPGPFQDLLWDIHGMHKLPGKISDLSGIPKENLIFSYLKGLHPFESLSQEVVARLSWIQGFEDLATHMDDGDIILYKDKQRC